MREKCSEKRSTKEIKVFHIVKIALSRHYGSAKQDSNEKIYFKLNSLIDLDKSRESWRVQLKMIRQFLLSYYPIIFAKFLSLDIICILICNCLYL